MAQAFTDGFQRAATFGFVLADEVHLALDHSYAQRKDLNRVARRMCKTGFVVFGVIVAMLGKSVYEVHAPSKDGELQPFAKPLFMVLLMFAGAYVSIGAL